MNDDESQSSTLPSMADFCLNVPLYEPFQFDERNEKELGELRWYQGNFDCYCMECGQLSVFHVESPSWQSTKLARLSNYLFDFIFYCSRNEEHKLFFFFRIHNYTITKIGQYPSLADIATIEIQKYRKVLGDDRYAEFNQAVGLTSHGVGIGAFVYLRRIFESLIEQAHQIEMSSDKWNEEHYQKSRMVDRIVLLKNSLPDFLVQNKSLYSILSKGIHELTEPECLSAFPVTKLGIELILDEKLEKQERDKKIKQASKDIGDLSQRLKSTNS